MPRISYDSLDILRQMAGDNPTNATESEALVEAEKILTKSRKPMLRRIAETLVVLFAALIMAFGVGLIVVFFAEGIRYGVTGEMNLEKPYIFMIIAVAITISGGLLYDLLKEMTD